MMETKDLMTHALPVLSLEDTGQRALQLMSEFRVFHLPLVQRDNYLALIAEDDVLDWDTPEEPLSLAEFVNFRPAVSLQSHPLEAMKLAREFSLSVVPVVDEHNHYAGMVTVEGLFNFVADQNTVFEPGAIVLLEIEPKHYALSEIARICESNDTNILGVLVKTKEDSGLQYITLKVNRTDLQGLIATFERFNYTVAAAYTHEDHREDLRSNYDLLMRLMNL